MENVIAIAEGCPTHSPWGAVQTGKMIIQDVFKVTTAEHGGIYVPPHWDQFIPKPFRTDDGWYEEDDAVDIVYWFIPLTADHNPKINREKCKERLQKYWSKQWAESGLN